MSRHDEAITAGLERKLRQELTVEAIRAGVEFWKIEQTVAAGLAAVLGYRPLLGSTGVEFVIVESPRLTLKIWSGAEGLRIDTAGPNEQHTCPVTDDQEDWLIDLLMARRATRLLRAPRPERPKKKAAGA